MRMVMAIGWVVSALLFTACQRVGGPADFSPDSRTPVSVPVVQGCRFYALPDPGEKASVHWRAIVATATAPVSLSLEGADRWYEMTVGSAMDIFRTGEPESMEWLEENARQRRDFMETWVRRDTPVLVVEGGAFRIAAPVAEALVAAALAQGDRERARLWMARADRSRVSEVCRESLAD